MILVLLPGLAWSLDMIQGKLIVAVLVRLDMNECTLNGHWKENNVNLFLIIRYYISYTCFLLTVNIKLRRMAFVNKITKGLWFVCK